MFTLSAHNIYINNNPDNSMITLRAGDVLPAESLAGALGELLEPERDRTRVEPVEHDLLR